MMLSTEPMMPTARFAETRNSPDESPRPTAALYNTLPESRLISTYADPVPNSITPARRKSYSDQAISSVINDAVKGMIRISSVMAATLAIDAGRALLLFFMIFLWDSGKYYC